MPSIESGKRSEMRRFSPAIVLVAVLGPQCDAAEFSLWRGEVRTRADMRSTTVVSDLDDDSREDVAFITTPGPVLNVLGMDSNDSIVIKQAVRIAPWPSQATISLGARLHSSSPPALFFSSGLDVVEFSGMPLQETRRIVGLGSPYPVISADIDVDGDEEIVRLTSEGLMVHDYATGMQEWSVKVYGNDLTVMQLDSDTPLEIVVSGNPGVVLDGATRAGEFVHSMEFGTVESFFHAGGLGFVSGRARHVDLFWTAPLRLVDSIPKGYGNVAAVDFDADGTDELAMASEDQTQVLVYDASSGAPVQAMTVLGSGPVRFVGVDLAGDGHEKLLVETSHPEHLLELLEPLPTSPSVVLLSIDGGHTPVARADVDADGDEEWLLASQSQVELREAGLGVVIWRWPEAGSLDPRDHWTSVRVKLEDLDDDDAFEMVLLGRDEYGARAMVFDATTHELELEWRTPEQGDIGFYRVAHDLQRVDADGDGIREWLLALSGEGSIGARLVLFSDQREVLWQSVPMGTTQNEILGLFVTQTDEDPALEWVVALPRSLRAYDSATRELEWSHEMQARHVQLLSGPAGDEFLVLGNGTISHVDALTRATTRSYPGVSGANAAAALPGGQGKFVVATSNYLYAFDGNDGSQFADRVFVGFLVATPSRQIAVVKEPSRDIWRVLLGDAAGWLEYRLFGGEILFSSGFEP
jgi:hypothetical protein